jgi:RNA 2',3'-cyclic 3'-phosphodiesterase
VVLRLFVAVWPPEALIEQLLDFPRPRIEGLRWTQPEQWHVTLDFLGAIRTEELSGVAAALESGLASVLAAVEATAGPAPGPLSAHVWAVPVKGLESLAATVRRSTSSWHAGGRPPQPYRGHLTLARTNRRAPPGVISKLERAALTCRWRIPEVSLVSSRTETEGAIYEVVDRWALPA